MRLPADAIAKILGIEMQQQRTFFLVGKGLP
jgi:hypothetical protein